MANWNDLSKLRQEMEMTQAQVMSLYQLGYSFEEISTRVNIPEKSARVIVAWRCK